MLTVRARLTLLCTGLFAACGAVIVAVSYTLMARLPVLGQDPPPSRPIGGRVRNVPDVSNGILAQCQAQQDPTLDHLPLLDNDVCCHHVTQPGPSLSYPTVTLSQDLPCP